MKLIELGGWAMLLALIMVMFCLVYGLDTFDEWIAERRAQRALMWEIDEAIRIDAVIEDLKALDRKVHYRWNVHCPACGRFARQPAYGITECKVHGLMTTDLLTGAIDIIEVTPIQVELLVVDSTNPQLEVEVLEVSMHELVMVEPTELPDFVTDLTLPITTPTETIKELT